MDHVLKYVFTGPPALTVSIIENATDLSTFVQWNEVDDFLPTNYTVTWTSDRTTPVQSITPIEQSYTITGLILDTVYNISVFAANECGQGPAFMTSVLFSTGSYVHMYLCTTSESSFRALVLCISFAVSKVHIITQLLWKQVDITISKLRPRTEPKRSQ